MEELSVTYISSPLGFIKISGSGLGVTSLEFEGEKGESDIVPSAPVRSCAAQLEEYFSGKRVIFTVPIDPRGTEFQLKVWENLRKVKCGTTVSYGNLAHTLGDRNASRAVAAANGANPIPIIIPCHRVIGGSGDLTGYSGGLWRKRWLLDHEQPCRQGELFR